MGWQLWDSRIRFRCINHFFASEFGRPMVMWQMPETLPAILIVARTFSTLGRHSRYVKSRMNPTSIHHHLQSIDRIRSKPRSMYLYLAQGFSYALFSSIRSDIEIDNISHPWERNAYLITKKKKRKEKKSWRQSADQLSHRICNEWRAIVGFSCSAYSGSCEIFISNKQSKDEC